MICMNILYTGTQYGSSGNFKFTFEKPILLVKGLNKIALLSVTVGFANYGAFFDLQPAGVTGPVQLIANVNGVITTKDLSNQQWNYMVGLVGEQKKYYTGSVDSLPWNPHERGYSRKFTWFIANFNSPVVNESIVLDMAGLGKGHAWVNGNSIGRYWPSYLATADGCKESCDYRGSYSPNKCNSNCGASTQRW
ncbi:hypothetical protein RND81_12G099700 [Saponaria officinalis]